MFTHHDKLFCQGLKNDSSLNNNLLHIISIIYIRNPNLKYENGFKHLWHLASGWAMNNNDENL